MCVFCDIKSHPDDDVMFLTDYDCFVLMDKFPINQGHFLVVSNRHVATLSELSEVERNNLFNLSVNLMSGIKSKNQKIKGFNVHVNDGKCAGQHFPHVHIHVIPRYKGDMFSFVFSLFFSKLNPVNYLSKNTKAREFLRDLKLVLNDEFGVSR